MGFPFEEKTLNNKRIRTFSPLVDENELKWHVDEFDRNVLVIEDGGWGFQMNNELPIQLKTGDKLFIPKQHWHRAIKGSDKLIIEIEEIIEE